MSASSANNKVPNDIHVIAATCVVFLIVLAFVIQTVVGSVAFLLGFTGSVYQLFPVGLAFILFAWTACILGARNSNSDVKMGGAAIAKRLGAVQASVRRGPDDEKALIKTVADIAIAYGCALPSIHVLREEDSINSMVVGSLSGDTAILFTNGALKNLKEDELSALTAHEFAHIANENVSLNMKLMVAFGGLLAIHKYGKVLVQKKHASPLLAPTKLLGFGFIGLGFVGLVFASFLRILYTRRTEWAADEKALAILKRSRGLCSALLRIKQSASSDQALHVLYMEEVRHLCFHAGDSLLWRTRFNSSHPNIIARIQKIDPQAAVDYAISAAEQDVSSKGHLTEPSIAKDTTSDTVYSEHSGSNVRSAAVSTAAGDAARALGIMSGVAQPIPVSDKLAMSVKDPVSSLAALFALFIPNEIEARPSYLSAVAFAYNQSFADSVEYLKEALKREIYVERLSVAKHATEQLKTKLAPDASRRVLLNIERLLKAQGLHNLMNYSTVQYLRHELAAEFPVLNRTADVNKPNAEGRHLVSIDKAGEEISRLISQVLDSTDLDRETVDREYDRVMALYPNADYPRCDEEELDDMSETEAAFQLLLMQPRAIRETFIQHCKEIFDLDKEDMQSKRSNLELFCASLGCSSLFGERLGEDGYGRKVA